MADAGSVKKKPDRLFVSVDDARGVARDFVTAMNAAEEVLAFHVTQMCGQRFWHRLQRTAVHKKKTPMELASELLRKSGGA